MSSRVTLVGISGPSSSGKTTLARSLRSLFPGSFILHEDDFYVPDGQIPEHNGLADWDCIESIDLPALSTTLEYIKTHGCSPPDLVSKEDQNSVGKVDIDHHVLDQLREKINGALSNDKGISTTLALIDGFLLFSEDMSHIRSLFDIKLFLKTNHKTAKARREARSGYVTLEGFWEDPPGYVDKIVWPNYVRDHAFLFERGDVEGKIDQEVASTLGIESMPAQAQGNMTACIEWACEVLMASLKAKGTMP